MKHSSTCFSCLPSTLSSQSNPSSLPNTIPILLSSFIFRSLFFCILQEKKECIITLKFCSNSLNCTSSPGEKGPAYLHSTPSSKNFTLILPYSYFNSFIIISMYTLKRQDFMTHACFTLLFFSIRLFNLTQAELLAYLSKHLKHHIPVNPVMHLFYVYKVYIPFFSSSRSFSLNDRKERQ